MSVCVVATYLRSFIILEDYFDIILCMYVGLRLQLLCSLRSRVFQARATCLFTSWSIFHIVHSDPSSVGQVLEGSEAK